jgi:hypothetical protein
MERRGMTVEGTVLEELEPKNYRYNAGLTGADIIRGIYTPDVWGPQNNQYFRSTLDFRTKNPDYWLYPDHQK